MVEFGEQLRRARENKGMTQQTLAEELFVARQSVSRWECGDRFPDLITTKKISEILDVSLDDLLSGKDMEKVVERNPVIENKIANSFMIILYAVVAFSYVLLFIKDFVLKPWEHEIQRIINHSYYYMLADDIIRIICLLFIITILILGLVHAIRGTLSPQKMGAIIMAFIIANIIPSLALNIMYLCDTHTNLENHLDFALGVILFNAIRLYIPMIIGAVLVYLFFIRKKDKIILSALLIVFCLWRIISAIYMAVIFVLNPDIYDKDPSHNSMMPVLDMLPTALIFGLVIYQVITLYKKRKAAVKNAE
ncbi:MAG: helix-turn-helix transcriptional regulator [Pseudobutyrivibrio sp.]|nr:helix-turn-helix transcriptional regulator [Pseudobutyrivibrio sp.]